MKDIYEDWYMVDPVAREHCTVSDLASMRSGLAGNDQAIGDIDTKGILRLLRDLPSSTGFRQTFQYCNLGYWLLAGIIPALTGTSFEVFSQERIFKPLGMDSTSGDRDANLASGRLADGWVADYDLKAAYEAWEKRGKESKTPLPDEMFANRRGFQYYNKRFKHFGPGPGHLISAQRDMAKWMKELMDPRIIPKEVIGRLTKPLTVTATNGRPGAPEEGIMTYGLGMFIYSYRGHTMWQHSGGLPGTCSYMVILPDENIGVMIMINDDDWGGPLCRAIPYAVIDKILGAQPVDWETRGLDDTMEYLASREPEFRSKQSPRPPLEARFVTGKFSNKAFGQLDLRPLSSAPEVACLLPMLERKSLTKLPSIDQMYVTDFHNLSTDFILVFPFDGPRYRYITFSTMDTQPTLGKKGPPDAIDHLGYAQVHKVVWVRHKGICVFNENGVGMFGGFTRPGAIEDMPKVSEEDVDKKAEVWFHR